MFALRRHRLFAAFLAVFSLLFMQLAVAAYVCPSAAVAVSAQAAVASHAGMPCDAAHMASKSADPQQPALCHAHCKSDSQSADTYQLPSLSALPAIPANFSLQVDRAIARYAAPLQAPLLQRSTAPPLAVQHCCFRI